MAATPSGKFVYAPNSTDSTISAYSLDGTSGALTQIAGSPFTTGPYPFGVVISPYGKFLYTANISGNTISAFSIDGATGTLTPLSGSPFAAGPYPQDLAFSPSGKFLYVSNSSGGTCFRLRANSDGSLTQVGPLYAAGLYPAALAVSPSGFLYVPNANSSTISVYSINAATGALTPISGSPFPGPGQPTQAAVAPSGQILYVSGGNSNDIAAYRINRTTGALTPISGSPFPGGGTDLFSVAISSSDQFLYTADENSFQISGYSINATTGALTPLAGSPFAGDGSYPDYITLVNPAVKSWRTRCLRGSHPYAGTLHAPAENRPVERGPEHYQWSHPDRRTTFGRAARTSQLHHHTFRLVSGALHYVLLFYGGQLRNPHRRAVAFGE